MPATPARIGFVTKPFRLSVAGPDAGVVSAFGNLARDVSPDEPVESFFIASADAQAMADERLLLLKANRRRFLATIADAGDFLLDVDNSQQIPVAQVIDPRANADRLALIARVRVDLKSGTGTVEAWG